MVESHDFESGYYRDQIAKELSSARQAELDGNQGRARVCARRAAGQAITWYLKQFPREGWGSDALSQLKALKDDVSFPQNVRDAAIRLTTKISDRFTYPFSTQPIDDARIIIDYIENVIDSSDADE